MKEWNSERHDYWDAHLRLFGTVCQSHTTEREAYNLSKSEEYDRAAASFRAGEDLRFSRNRHAACYQELKEAEADSKHLPRHRVNVDVLTACRQAYVEASPILWSTNT